MEFQKNEKRNVLTNIKEMLSQIFSLVFTEVWSNSKEAKDPSIDCISVSSFFTSLKLLVRPSKNGILSLTEFGAITWSKLFFCSRLLNLSKEEPFELCELSSSKSFPSFSSWCSESWGLPLLTSYPSFQTIKLGRNLKEEDTDYQKVREQKGTNISCL